MSVLETEAIHIVLTLRDKDGSYSRHAAVTAVSIIENTEKKVIIHILHDDTVTAENMAMLRSLEIKGRAELDFINVEEMFKRASLNISKRNVNISRAMYFRLFIPDVISAEKVIYLDCDMVVNLDIDELWREPLHGTSIAAVPDVETFRLRKTHDPSWRQRVMYRQMGIEMESYFNGGTLVMDLTKIREKINFLDSVIKFYEKFGKITTYGNQDCLNYIFVKDCTLLDEKYNRIRLETPPSDMKAIWHMAGEIKPWNTYTRPGVDELYWEYLRKTAYIKNERELISVMLKDLASPKFVHLHTSACSSRLKGQLKDNILRGHIWTVPRILWLEIKSLLK